MRVQSYTNEELTMKAASGDISAMSTLYEQNIGLIISVCKKAYHNCNSPKSVEFEDLNQEAAYSFVISVPKFKPNDEHRFSTFISKCIYNHIIDFLGKHINYVSHEQITDRNTIFSSDTNQHNYRGISNILEQNYWQMKTGMISISAEEAYFKRYYHETIKNALDSLSPRQNRFISYLFGLGGDNEEYLIRHTLDETTTHFNLSKAEQRKIKNSALKTMRKYCYEKLSTIPNCSLSTERSPNESSNINPKITADIFKDLTERVDLIGYEGCAEDDEVDEFDMTSDYDGYDD